MVAIPTDVLAKISPDCQPQVRLANDWKVSELERITSIDEKLAAWTTWFGGDYRKLMRRGVPADQLEPVVRGFQNDIAQDVRDLKWFVNQRGHATLEETRNWVSSRLIDVNISDVRMVLWELNFADLDHPENRHERLATFDLSGKPIPLAA